ncbi:LysR family transcriptional regulator [Paenalcaligenes sp.]|uniref:LysR family transcriptional regulator n=1 Tax=Paenalcaligenes sp. TaxID=1966342 RepID=UPI002638BC3C|nr:LysR family transcriptional regulator [Paenalcaligenes sp.]
MRIEHIEYFVATARLGSIAKAALSLGRRRSTVSMAISALEDELGVKLFERTGNSLQLSAIGESILDDCHRLLSLSLGIKQRCLIGDHAQRQELRIGRDDALSEAFWRHIILQLRQRYPHLSLSMRFASSDELPDLVRQQQLDIAYGISENLYDPADGLHRRVLGRVVMRMMIAHDHPLSRLQHVTDTDLRSLAQITYMDSSNQERFHLEHVGSERIALSSFELVRDAIRDGLGWGYVPEPLLQLEQRDAQELTTLRHGLMVTGYPYLVYSREVLVAAGPQKNLLSEVNELVAAAMLEISSESLLR